MSVAERLATIEVEMKTLREDYGQLTDVVTQQSQIIREFQDERQRNIGARKAIGIVWGLLTTGVAGVAYMLHDIVQYLWPPRMH